MSMYAKDAGLTLGQAQGRGQGRKVAGSLALPDGVRRFANQVLFLAPLFWFMELAQNKLYLFCTGDYGWGYPGPSGPTTPWYSLRSLPLWVVTVFVFSVLDQSFERRQTARVLRFLIAGSIGWAGEWVSGFLSVHVMHRALQIWPGSSLVYVSFSALPIWWMDFVIFQWLTRELRDAHSYRVFARPPGGSPLP